MFIPSAWMGGPSSAQCVRARRHSLLCPAQIHRTSLLVPYVGVLALPLVNPLMPIARQLSLARDQGRCKAVAWKE